MKKIVFVLSFFFAFSGLKATHLLGGYITWEYFGNNQYKFKLTALRDCQGVSIGGTVENIAWPGGVIPVAYSQAESGDVSRTCRYCANGQGLEKHVWKSAMLQFFGTPPASGWEFSWTTSAIAVNNSSSQGVIHISSTMYKQGNSTPQFIEQNSYDLLIYKGKPQFLSSGFKVQGELDSVRHRFSPWLAASNSAATYYSGYTFDQPFPNPNTNTANGLAQINPITGVVETDVQSGNSGLYVFSVAADGYEGGNLANTVNILQGAFYADSTYGNTAPLISTSLDTVGAKNYNMALIDAYIGDTVVFTGSVTDIDMPTNLMVKAGAEDEIPGGASGNLTFNTSSSPGVTTFTFKWFLDPALYQQSKEYRAHIYVNDSSCPMALTARLDVVINAKSRIAIHEDSLQVCYGDSLNATLSNVGGGYWTPSNIVDDSLAANPVIIAQTSQYIYLVDSSNPSVKDSVWLNVTSLPVVVLNQIGATLEVTVPNWTEIIWYLNGVPLTNGLAFITPTINGDYYAKVFYGNCSAFSDTVTYANGQFFSMLPINNGTTTEALPFDKDYGFGFDVNAGNMAIINSVTLYGITDSTEANDTITLRIFDNQGTILKSAKAARNGLEAQFNLDSGLVLPANSYKISFAAPQNSGLYLYMLQNVSYPYNVWLLDVTEGLYAVNGDNPVQQSAYQVAAYVEMNASIGLKDVDAVSLKIYPNPVQDYLVVEGVGENEEINMSILDVTGKPFAVDYQKDGNKLIINTTSYQSGVYLIKINGATQKFVKQ